MEREIGQLFQMAATQRAEVTSESVDYRNYRALLTESPSRAYTLAKKVMKSLSSTLTGAVWAEFESTNAHLFSEVTNDAGCSNGASLSLKTPLGEATGLVTAKISVPQRSTGPMEMWIAARIPNPADKAAIRVKVGGQLMSLVGPPMSPYGSGFAWYLCGTTRLPTTRTDVIIELTGTPSTDISLDCLMLSPQPFQPMNVMMPELNIGTATPPKKPGLKGG